MPPPTLVDRSRTSGGDRASFRGGSGPCVPVLLQPGAGLGQRKRLPAEFVRVDQYDLERRTRTGAIRRAVESPEFVRAAEKLLVAPAFLPAAEFGKLIAKEDAEIAQAVRMLGLRQDSK